MTSPDESWRSVVPYWHHYVGTWALWEPHVPVLLEIAQRLKLESHLADFRARLAAQEGAVTPQVRSDGIVEIRLAGTLMKHISSLEEGTSTVLARRQIRAAAAAEQVRGILLVVDSPGGTVAGTAELAAEIRAARQRKPVHAHIEDIGASAAYLIASQADRLTASESAIVGGIGVYTVVHDLSRMAEQSGIQVHVVRFGEFKGAGTPGTPITEEQLAEWQRVVDQFGEDFIATVALGRGMTVDDVRALADGRVWKGADAKKHRFVDAIESYDQTIAQLRASVRTKARTGMSENESIVAESTGPSVPQVIAQLREACPGASDAFLLEQLQQGADLTTAMREHARLLAEQNARLEAERNELRATVARTKRGVEPIGGVESMDGSDSERDTETVSARELLWREVAKHVASGCSRPQAVKRTFAAYPGLREQVIAEANGARADR